MDLRLALGAWGILQLGVSLWSGVCVVLQTVFFGAMPMLAIIVACAEELAPFTGLVRQEAISDCVQQTTTCEDEGEPPEIGDEKLHWLNSLIEQMWPHIAQYLEDFIRSYEATIQAYMPLDIRFKSCSLGAEPIKLGPVRPRLVPSYCGERLVEKGGVELKIGIKYKSKVDIELATKVANFGVSDLAIAGTLSVFFRPLMSKAPFFGGIELLFTNPPIVEIGFKGISNLTEMPIIRGRLQKAIDDAIAGWMVVPNRLVWPFVDETEVNQARLRHRNPEGVLRITVVKAENLLASDVSIRKKSCDPYVSISVSGNTFKTPSLMRTVNPVWTEGNVSDFAIYSLEQLVQVDVFDYERIAGGDILGSINRRPVHELLENAGKGPVPVRLERHRQTNRQPFVSRQPSEDALLFLRIDWQVLVQPEDADDIPPSQRAAVLKHQGVNRYLLTLSIDRCSGLPDIDLNAPFTVRVRAKGDEQNGKSSNAGWVESADAALFAKQLDNIRRLSSRGVEDSLIADVMGQDVELIKGLLRADRTSGVTKRFSPQGEGQKQKDIRLIDKLLADRDDHNLRCDPHFEEVLVLLLVSRHTPVVVELVDDPVKRRKEKGHKSNGIIAYFEVNPETFTILQGPFKLLAPHRDAVRATSMMAEARLHGTFHLSRLQPGLPSQTNGQYFKLSQRRKSSSLDSRKSYDAFHVSPLQRFSIQAGELLSQHRHSLKRFSNQLHSLGASMSQINVFDDAFRERHMRSEDRIEEVVSVALHGHGRQVYKALKRLRDAAEWEQAVLIFETKYAGSGSIGMVDVVQDKLDADLCQRLAQKLHLRGIGSGRWPICTTTLDDFIRSS